jgi:hypothetical protein
MPAILAAIISIVTCALNSDQPYEVARSTGEFSNL